MLPFLFLLLTRYFEYQAWQAIGAGSIYNFHPIFGKDRLLQIRVRHSGCRWTMNNCSVQKVDQCARCFILVLAIRRKADEK